MVNFVCPHCEDRLCAAKVPIFSDLTEPELLQISATVHRLNLNKGDVLYREGDLATQLLIVNSGQIRLYKLTPDGKEQILDIIRAGDFTGELDLFQTRTYDSSAVAQTAAGICSIRHSDIRQLILDKPEIGLKLLGAMNRKVSHLRSLVQNLATNDGTARLIQIILQLLEQSKTKPLIKLDLSREDLANFTGMTRETVSRKISQLQDLGWIRLSGSRQLTVLNEQAMRDYMPE